MSIPAADLDGVTSRRRVLIYSHDSYGLGHLRRNLLIAGRLTALPGAPAVLVVTGSPRAQAFSLPAGVDTVKLPAATKDGDGRYRSRTIGLPLDGLVALRRHVAEAAIRAFQPDVILVDHAPLGLAGELTSVLQAVADRPKGPALVLGLRDVVDEASRVQNEWERDGVWPLLDLYDRVLVYGDARLGTTATDLDLDRRLGGKVRHVGYLGRPELLQPTKPARRHRPPTVLVTTGGGGDGHPLCRAYADYLASQEAPPGLRSTVVTGPLMSNRRRLELARRFRPWGHQVQTIEFTDHIERLITRADALVTMAGYNTVVEALSARRPALLVPREAPRQEQRVRADRLSSVPGIEVCTASRLDPARIGSFVRAALDRPRQTDCPPVNLDGLEGVADHVAELLGTTAGRSN